MTLIVTGAALLVRRGSGRCSRCSRSRSSGRLALPPRAWRPRLASRRRLEPSWRPEAEWMTDHMRPAGLRPRQPRMNQVDADGSLACRTSIASR